MASDANICIIANFGTGTFTIASLLAGVLLCLYNFKGTRVALVPKQNNFKDANMVNINCRLYLSILLEIRDAV